MTSSGLAQVRAEAAQCRNCDLWKHATQTVFGEGPAPAGLMLVGVRPRVVVCLGATAAQALLGRSFRLTQHRGEAIETEWAPTVLATFHPSVVLRAPDASARAEAERGLIADLKLAVRYLRRRKNTAPP